MIESDNTTANPTISLTANTSKNANNNSPLKLKRDAQGEGEEHGRVVSQPAANPAAVSCRVTPQPGS